jgi:hypothetical protein
MVGKQVLSQRSIAATGNLPGRRTQVRGVLANGAGDS